ncbi:class I SAM-dependent methyltransferase [Sulfuricurvum sp.]|uniref:class I SAM-dependent methyltransferase n=1 Tax=Sulfuricurvum sp. TaxID=2025608 RepID=UPI003BB48929
MKHFTSEPLTNILEWANETLAINDTISLKVLNPDIGREHYAGEIISINQIDYLYRSYKAWSDLGELLFCRMLTPKLLDNNTVIITYEKLNLNDSFHLSTEKEEKYGTSSRFASIHKNEEPAFLSAYLRALKSVKIGEKKRILNLGINTGDEFELIRQMLSSETYYNLSLVGIDFSQSAINVAQERFHEGNATFYVHDINDLASLNLGKFDLIITIGTLQSTSLEFKPLFASLVQEYLTTDGAMILGFPNCRWMGGEMIYGAKAPNYPYSELSILIKDIYYCKKYLQQKKFRVTVTGKDYLFLTATKIVV